MCKKCGTVPACAKGQGGIVSYIAKRHGKSVREFRFRTDRITAAAKALLKINRVNDPRWYLPYNTAGIDLPSFYPSAVIQELNQLSL